MLKASVRRQLDSKHNILHKCHSACGKYLDKEDTAEDMHAKQNAFDNIRGMKQIVQTIIGFEIDVKLKGRSRAGSARDAGETRQRGRRRPSLSTHTTHLVYSYTGGGLAS